jgi:hypothetical protein
MTLRQTAEMARSSRARTVGDMDAHPRHRAHVEAGRFGGTARHRIHLCLNELQPLQARVPVLADDDVIVHRNAERACD